MWKALPLYPSVQNSLTFILGHPCRGQENQAAEGPRQALSGEALEREEKTTPGRERGRVTVEIYKMTHTTTSALAGLPPSPSGRPSDSQRQLPPNTPGHYMPCSRWFLLPCLVQLLCMNCLLPAGLRGPGHGFVPLSAQNRPSINTRSMNEGTTWDKGQRMGGFCIRAEELCPIQCCDTGAALCDSEVPITLLEEWKWQWGPAHQTREGRPERTRRPNSSPHPKGPTTRRFYEHATGCEASLPRQGQALQAVPTQCHSPDSGIL